jgi:hypothetical protein
MIRFKTEISFLPGPLLPGQSYLTQTKWSLVGAYLELVATRDSLLYSARESPVE